MRSASRLGLLSLSWLLAMSCQPALDPISEVSGVRIIGVQKSAPYARPGEEVVLSMLWEDGTLGAPREVQTFFAYFCVNPSGDLYSECLSAEPSIEPLVVFNRNQVTITIPEDILRTTDPALPPNGTAFVYYGVCAGQLAFGDFLVEGHVEGSGVGGAAGDGSGVSGAGADGTGADGAETDGLGGAPPPLGGGALALPTCLGPDGDLLGARDFVVGYSTVFAYEELRNQNPRIDGFEVEGKPVSVDCIDAACDAPFDVSELDDCGAGVPCFDRCTEDDASMCPEIRMSVVVDPSSLEQDELARLAYGEELGESVWVSYYADRGTISDNRLVNDAELGPRDEYDAVLRAPAEPGPIRIWAAVRDNRGGVSWVRLAGYVR